MNVCYIVAFSQKLYAKSKEYIKILLKKRKKKLNLQDNLDHSINEQKIVLENFPIVVHLCIKVYVRSYLAGESIIRIYMCYDFLFFFEIFRTNSFQFFEMKISFSLVFHFYHKFMPTCCMQFFFSFVFDHALKNSCKIEYWSAYI